MSGKQLLVILGFLVFLLVGYRFSKVEYNSEAKVTEGRFGERYFKYGSKAPPIFRDGKIDTFVIDDLLLDQGEVVSLFYPKHNQRSRRIDWGGGAGKQVILDYRTCPAPNRWHGEYLCPKKITVRPANFAERKKRHKLEERRKRENQGTMQAYADRNRNVRHVRRQEFGEAWPFQFGTNEGLLECRPVNEVVFRRARHGHRYAINGKAMTFAKQRGYKSSDDIVQMVSASWGGYKRPSLGPLIRAGLALCD